MMNHLVSVNGTEANAFTYGTWRLVRKAVDGNPLWDGSGWYDDKLVKTAAGWRIKKRVAELDFRRIAAATGAIRSKDHAALEIA